MSIAQQATGHGLVPGGSWRHRCKVHILSIDPYNINLPQKWGSDSSTVVMVTIFFIEQCDSVGLTRTSPKVGSNCPNCS